MFEHIFRSRGANDTPDQKSTESIYIDVPIAPVLPAKTDRNRPVFTGMEDHSISLEEAGALTGNYRRSAGPGSVKGKFFSRAAIEQLLAQEDTVGIRYYYGTGADDKQEMIIVGVNGLGQDLHEGFIFGNPLPMSKFQSEPNPLNS